MTGILGTPVSYGGLMLKNRIIFAPTTMGLGDEAYFAEMDRIAAGGCAMIIVGDVPVGKGGMGHSLYSKRGMAFYQRLAEIVHQHDCRLCAQLHQSDSHFSGLIKYVPQMITGRVTMMQMREKLNEMTGPYITALPTEKVKAITASFGDAAVQAVKLGFDMVQVHGDRMCGSFSSTVFNHREDEYGGCVENRARFAREAVEAIRKKLPGMPIDYKLAVRQENPHYGNAGVLEEEIAAFVPILERAGVTSFHVALANHGRLEDTIPPANHPEFRGQGCFLKFCDEVRRYTKLPVCGVGGLSDPAFVEEQIASGRIDCAAMSRQLIADPQWPEKVIAGTPEKVRRCVRCNKACLGGMYEHKGVHCIFEGR